MATSFISMQYKRVILLVVACFLMSQLVNGDVNIENNSLFTVSVYDTNTTLLINPLPPNDYTSFNLGSAGPDFFLVQKIVGGVALSSCTIKVIDNDTLVLYTSGNALMYVVNDPNPARVGRKSGPALSFKATGSFCA